MNRAMRPALLATALTLAATPCAAQPSQLQDITIAMPNFTFTSCGNRPERGQL
jgi:hypothetical protein